MVSPRDFFENKVNDDFLRDLLEIIEMFNVPITLETIHSGLAIYPEQYGVLAKKKKSALEFIRRKLGDLSDKGLVVIEKKKDEDPRRGCPCNTYKLPASIKDELNDFLDIKKRQRLYTTRAAIACNRIPCKCGLCKKD